jgi:hypothetical protein
MSPPTAIPFRSSRNCAAKTPAEGSVTSGVGWATQVRLASMLRNTRETVPPVPNETVDPTADMHVPPAANPNSPSTAGGIVDVSAFVQ